jgi:hypothetical protein
VEVKVMVRKCARRYQPEAQKVGKTVKSDKVNTIQVQNKYILYSDNTVVDAELSA